MLPSPRRELPIAHDLPLNEIGHRRSLGLRALLPLVFLSALVASGSSADAVSPSPLYCARGLRPASSHGGPFCALDLCTPGQNCADGGSCVARRFCIVPRTGHAIDGSFVDETATTSCSTDLDCGSAGTCRAADVCMDVDGFRRRGIVIFALGLGALTVVVFLAVASARERLGRPRL